ncbi:MAG: hypothetical protein ACRED1_12765, partial [Limisphaerales bacterium]
PPMLIPSKTVWRLVHTPDPPMEQLRNSAVSAQFFWNTRQTTTLPDYWYMRNNTNTVLWHYLHHQSLPKIEEWQINYEKKSFPNLFPTPTANDRALEAVIPPLNSGRLRHKF